MVLTFPDGEDVKEGELGKWLQMVKDHPEICEEEIEVAEGIVKYMRARLS